MPAQSSSPVNQRYRLEPELLAAGAIVLVTLIVAANRFYFDNWLARHDLLAFFIPWYGFLGDQLRAGHIPGWNPHLFAGAPLAGDPESGWMYLPAMVSFALLQAAWAFKAVVLVQLLIAGLSTYLYGRLIGFGVAASLVAATAYEFGPFLYQNMYCCTVRAQLGAWIPLAFAGVELALLTTRWRYRVAAWFIGGLAVSQWMAGFMGQGVLDALVLLAAYIGYRTIFSPMRPGRSPRQWLIDCASTGIGVVALGFALGAAGLLIRLTVNQASTIAGGNYADIGQANVDAVPYSGDKLLTLIFGSGYNNQAVALGGVVIVLALLSPFIAGRRYGVPFFATMTIVVYILTLQTTPLHELFYLIPKFKEFHVHRPSQVTSIVLIGPAMLAAATVECLPGWRGDRRVLGYLAFPVAIFVLVFAQLTGQPLVVGHLSVLGGLVTVAILFVAFLLAARLRRSLGDRLLRVWLPLVLVVGIIMQFAGIQVVQSTFGIPFERSWVSAYKTDPGLQSAVRINLAKDDPKGAGEFLQQQMAKDGPFRFAGYAGLDAPHSPFNVTNYSSGRLDPSIMAILANTRPMQLGLQDIQGYNPLQLKNFSDYLAILNGKTTDYHFAMLLSSGVQSPLLNMLNVRFIVVPAILPPDRPDMVALAKGRTIVFKNDQVVVYATPAALPRAWLVHDVRQTDGIVAAEEFADGSLDPHVTATVGGPPPAVAPLTAGATESASVTEYQADGLTVKTQAASNGFLVLSEIYVRGWKATVDGKAATIYEANGALRGIVVPAGAHTVRLTYAPTSLTLGLAISGAAGLAMLGSFALAALALWYDHRTAILRLYYGPITRRSVTRDDVATTTLLPRGRRLVRRGAKIVQREGERGD